MADPRVRRSGRINVSPSVNQAVQVEANINSARPNGGIAVGNYLIFVDSDGGLKIRAPDGTLATLMVVA